MIDGANFSTFDDQIIGETESIQGNHLTTMCLNFIQISTYFTRLAELLKTQITNLD